MSALPQATPGPSPQSPPHPPLPRTSVLVMVLLTIVTLGFYLPVWYLRRLEAFNALRSTVKLTPLLPWLAIGANVLSLGTGVLNGVMNALGAEGLAVLAAVGDRVIGLATLIVYLVLGFRARDVLLDHLRAGIADYGGETSVALQSHASISGVLTFLFNGFYLQWKINDHHRELTRGAQAED